MEGTVCADDGQLLRWEVGLGDELVFPEGTMRFLRFTFVERAEGIPKRYAVIAHD